MKRLVKQKYLIIGILIVNIAPSMATVTSKLSPELLEQQKVLEEKRAVCKMKNKSLISLENAALGTKRSKFLEYKNKDLIDCYYDLAMKSVEYNKNKRDYLFNEAFRSGKEKEFIEQENIERKRQIKAARDSINFVNAIQNLNYNP